MGNKFRESKAFNIILAVLVAIGLWVYVTVIVSDATTITVPRVPVTVVGGDVLNGKGMMIDPGSELTVDLTLAGGRTDLVSAASNISGYFSVSVNVADINAPGTYQLPCSISSRSAVFTTGVRLFDQEEKTVTVVVTRLLSKTVEVRGTFTGTVDEENGYRANAAEITPGAISVQGPEELVSQIDHARVKIPGDGLTRTYSGELSFELVTAEGELVEDAMLTTNVDRVSVVLPVVKTLQLPLDVEFIYGGGVTEDNFSRYVEYRIEPESIQISGEESAITPLEGKTRSVGRIDLAAVERENQTYTFPIDLATELSNDSGISDVTVTVTVKGLETRTIETSNIDIINVPNGFTADAVTQSLQVRVRGPFDVLDSVTGDQLRVVVDLEGENLRQAQFPFSPRIYLDGDERCGVVTGSGGYIVVVNIQAQ